MANDSMRTGPRGASDQAAWHGPYRTPLMQAAGVIDPLGGPGILALARAATGRWQGAAAIGAGPEVDKDAAVGSILFGAPGTRQFMGTSGVSWTLSSLTACCTEAFLTNPTAPFTVGIYALGPGGADVPILVDADAFVTSRTLAVADMTDAGLVEVEIALTGVGAGLDDNGGTGTNLVSYQLGPGTGQYTDAGVDVRGFLQFLVMTVPRTAAAGQYVVHAEFLPSGGTQFGG